ncbi:FAD dependent oxidoreductase [uncultured Sphingopyxis sp.]|uniref:FAD dependent oxidoreductase n=1 Tax=uncultured Sphingopyxis sp. TaxID=310581 RepID=A0A1Y5PNZ3_9SPHN|nr:FAD-binding oxidoreductase [uncultured Sphingopyxis sp.]SBV31681.1 FAD dependent oxidoreductase [uncultured Sphingopyxis sp.]
MRVNIIGGGIVGLCSGMALAEAGHRVTIIDDDADRRAASWGNAGHIATEQVAPLASPASLRTAFRRPFAAGGPLDLPLSGVRHWLGFLPRFLAAARPAAFRSGSAALGSLLDGALPAWQHMAALAGKPMLLRADGHYILWENAAIARAGSAAWHAADIGTASLHTVEAAEMARLASLVGVPIADALRFQGSGQITDLGALADALEDAFRARGGTIERSSARLAVDGGRARVEGHDADIVVVAAGVRSRALMEQAGHVVPLIAERGYHIRAAAGEWPAGLPPLVFEDRAMIVTRFADTVQAASFVEFHSPGAPPDPRKWDRLERHVRELGLPFAPPFTRWMGARPTLPDYLPAIGRSRRIGNLVYAFGHQHLGLTLAAVTGDLVRALIERERPMVDLAPFDLARFGE